MIAYLSGKLTHKSPTYVIVENAGFGFKVNISLNTYSAIQQVENVKLHTSLIVKNEGQSLSGYELYGFAEETEKDLFEMLISVSGIGASTARIMLSAHKPDDIKQAIVLENEMLIQSIKGIGPKTAKRVILELKDKVSKAGVTTTATLTNSLHNSAREEALYALIALGYQKAQVEKVLMKIIAENPGSPVETLVKAALKSL
ncbi:MAG: Holliday junction branch migration protein RuvA [Chitinophagales bacterium]|nr:Holliday junction branch migration protein RuvA [Chitinophagales bacterium]OJV28339.1 MAG: Holliday junction DNA helicase RuvA [Bacteroidetes bacterium 37-13]HRN93375.1 Holliday junction branch migration protein RuvA [Chitinophagales bacterium]HRP38671.1 Holliday junction branch migration protein RuvA [Chitinophagales bacterium]